ncbi:L10-interacting MYB domain-containing protein [Camellia lanceoleosa]|uniref:L10-interacting MYB domain-containing protein n=1 Tax=Camellia lanceoleosa TaxID=1840588 RepID=A0ACC0IF30_9ERIC|nr:L10-interacting MYB domain-containing protein [Camellia lanceoleosa]
MKRVLRSTPQDSRSPDLKRKKTEAATIVREGRRRSSPFPDDSPSRSLMASHRSTPRTPSGKGKRQQAYHKATWDEESTQILLELVVKEIEAGNQPHMSITPNGYRSLFKTFEVATGRLHSPKQLKNKYNLLKTEWRAWCKLMDCRKGPTGIGFDQETGLFNASADWWAKMEKLYM